MKRLISPNEKLGGVLSPLEEDIMAVLWSKQRMRVRDIHLLLKHSALSSIAVTLDRLYERKVVGRDVEKARGGVRYIYFPMGDQTSFEKGAVETTVNKLIERFGDSAVSYFNERFNKRH